jgi:aminopeptidase N
MTWLVGGAAALRAGKPLPDHHALASVLTAALSDAKLEPAFISQAISLPSEADIAREIGRDVDPDTVHQARSRLRARLGELLGDTLRETYRRMEVAGPYSPDAISAGRRDLRNTCLQLLTSTRQPAEIARAAQQFAAADNMTDRMAALTALAPHDVPEREAALQAFYDRFEHDPLVIDKWFVLQAGIPEPGTLARVEALTSHPAFSFANPNRVRSLIGTFAGGNPTQFNRADGRGYAFIADTVLALDPRNPQVAARIAGAFRSWRTLEPGRRAHARSALERIAAQPGLSRDLADIAQRSLADEAQA